jgi:RNA polymerase sigma-70 factor (ECF subfamily)
MAAVAIAAVSAGIAMLLRIVLSFDRCRGTDLVRLDAVVGSIGSRSEPDSSLVRTTSMREGLRPVVRSAAPAPPPARSMRKDLTHLSDEALVALVARGDEPALGELYDRIGRVAYGMAFRILRDDRLAEDAVQEGFLAVWRSAATFRPERAKASTWIVTLVHRRAVDLVRREERRRAEPLDLELRDASDPAGSAEDEAWLGFERERVQRLLRTLPDAQRETLELAYYGGYSQSELAERLGVPLGTIKSRMFAGLARLRELLDDTESEGSWTPRLTS